MKFQQTTLEKLASTEPNLPFRRECEAAQASSSSRFRDFQLFFLLVLFVSSGPRVHRSQRSNSNRDLDPELSARGDPIPSRSPDHRISRRCDPRRPRAAGFGDEPADAFRSCAAPEISPELDGLHQIPRAYGAPARFRPACGPCGG